MIRNWYAAVSWWRDLQPDPERQYPGDRATLARLRRCGDIAELMLEPATIGLFRRVEADRADDLPLVALAAGVLAHVRADEPAILVARQIGPDNPDKPETALMKPLRFRRLMEAETPDERLIAFRRLVALARNTLSARDLAGSLLGWTDERRRRWALAYWNADPLSLGAAPAAENKSVKEIA